MTRRQTTPNPLVEHGRVRAFGLFDAPFRDLNILDADIGVPAFLRPYRLKEWQHIALVGRDLFMGFAITTSHYMSVSFCYAVDRKDGRFVEHHREKLGGKIARVARTLWDDHCRYQVSGYEIGIHNHLDAHRHEVRIDIAQSRQMPAIHASVEFTEDLNAVEPLIVVLPISENRPLYTHKMVCPLKGEVRVGDRSYTFDPGKDLALLDVQKTYYPYNTTWRWATFAGYDAEGRQLGMNLVRNMVQPDDQWNENVIWVDGKLSQVSGARFEFDLANCLSPWRITSIDGRIDLTFTPMGERAERINMGLVLSDYHAPYGHFSGTVVDDAGKAYTVDRLFGVAEFHQARF